MDKKVCRKCQIEKDLGDFYKDAAHPSGYKAVCRKCHYARSHEARKRRKLMERYQTPPKSQLSIENNLQALQRMVKQYGKGPEPVYARTQLAGAAFPIENGAAIKPGKVGPVLDYQTATKPIRKSLSVEPLFHIANEMAGYGIEILWDSLPLPLDIERQMGDNNSQESGEDV